MIDFRSRHVLLYARSTWNTWKNFLFLILSRRNLIFYLAYTKTKQSLPWCWVISMRFWHTFHTTPASPMRIDHHDIQKEMNLKFSIGYWSSLDKQTSTVSTFVLVIFTESFFWSKCIKPWKYMWSFYL